MAWSLLHDEDDNVRAAAARLCSLVAPESDIQATDATPRHPECQHAVQERVALMLAKLARTHPALLRCMLRWVCEVEATPSQPAATPCKLSRLFEREKVNDYEEPSTAAWCAARALATAAAMELSPACMEELVTWQRSVEALHVASEDVGAFDLLARVAREVDRGWQCQVALAKQLSVVLCSGGTVDDWDGPCSNAHCTAA